jgi:quercetin dioxygenase-like cupin family protein
LGEEIMPAMEKKSLNQPEETNTPEKLKMEAVTIRGLTIRRITAQPGWQWSKHLQPVQKTKSCQKDHILYVISGRLGVRMDDGKEVEFGPGDVGSIPPGHDGRTLGDNPVDWIEIPHPIN